MQSLQSCHSYQCRPANTRKFVRLPGVQHAHLAAHPRTQNVQRKRKSFLVRAEEPAADRLELGLVRLISELRTWL